MDDFVSDDELIDYEWRTSLKTDIQIKDSIEGELWWSPFVNSDEVTVTVDDGVATLIGTVDTWGKHRSSPGSWRTRVDYKTATNSNEGGAILFYRRK